jgi:hypothetical protein
MLTLYSALPKAAVSIFRQAFSLDAHRNVKLWLIVSATLHVAEFLVCNFFFAQFSTPFFVAPVAAPLNGSESFLYAHSITRQYGFFAIQLAALALFVASNPPLYQHATAILALARGAMAGFGLYAFAQGDLTLAQLAPSFLMNASLAVMLFRNLPRERATFAIDEELKFLTDKFVFGVRLAPMFQFRSLQALCIIAGALWMLWGLGSSVFWEIGVANISSDRAAELNLLNAMQANHIVRNQQGALLFVIGAATALAAYFPISHHRLLEFVMAQQIINALSAVLELMLDVILLPQFLTVFGVQAATFLLFYALYSKPTTQEKSEPSEARGEA